MPDYYTTSAGTFRILSDHLGSPRLIVNASTGAVVEEIDYDEFGNVTNDTQPGTTPSGFAGGIYDPDTGLVRFGARDYDARVGRWTSKDPMRFGHAVRRHAKFNVTDLNLYAYVRNNPVSLEDPSGLQEFAWAEEVLQLWRAYLASFQGEGRNVSRRRKRLAS